MFRNILFGVSAVIVAVAAFLGTLHLTKSLPHPDLPPSLPASDLQKVIVPRAKQIAINNLIAEEGVSRYGIVSESYNNARVLTKTELGPLYIIPGTNGMCLALLSVLRSGVSCSDDELSSEPVVVSLMLANHNNQLVGGGLVTSDAKKIELMSHDGSRIQTKRTKGGFVVTSVENVSTSRNRGYVFVSTN